MLRGEQSCAVSGGTTHATIYNIQPLQYYNKRINKRINATRLQQNYWLLATLPATTINRITIQALRGQRALYASPKEIYNMQSATEYVNVQFTPRRRHFYLAWSCIFYLRHTCTLQPSESHVNHAITFHWDTKWNKIHLIVKELGNSDTNFQFPTNCVAKCFNNLIADKSHSIMLK